MNLELASPWALRAPSGRVVVRDAQGMPFYVMAERDANAPFTLPEGRYITDVPVELVEPLPEPPERILPPPLLPIPESIRVSYGSNPHKCSIDRVNGSIFMDRSFLHRPSFIRTFVLFHEIGHYYFTEEADCDKFAADEMLARGFNPSQVHQASSMTLSANSDHRKQSTYKHLLFR